MKTVLRATIALALTATAALAADLPSRVAPPVFVPPVALFSWTGFEAGLHSAYTFGDDNRVRTTGFGTPANDFRPAYLSTRKDGDSNIGAGIGYNYQITPGTGAVIGVSLDSDWVDLDKNAYYLAPPLLSVYHQRLDFLTTANGHLGYAFGRLLVYGAGGFAFGDPGYGAIFTAPGALANRYIGGNNGSLKGGYDFGGGIEYAIPDGGILDKFAIEKIIGLDRLLGVKLSTVVKLEYIHYNLGSETVVLNNTGIRGATGAYNLRFHSEGDQVRAGLIYSISSATAPVVARY